MQAYIHTRIDAYIHTYMLGRIRGIYRGKLHTIQDAVLQFKDALMQSELGADMAVHGEEVCPAQSNGTCEIAYLYIYKKATTTARTIQDI